MFKCKQAIEGSACGKDICCLECEEKTTCDLVCSLVETKNVMNAESCEDAIAEGTELATFEEKTITIMKTIANIASQKAALEEQDKSMRKQLETVMEQYGVKSFENDILKITYVAPTTKTSVDSKKLKEKHPDIFAECSKTSDVKGSVRITVK
jgi:predicted phage-related endonuclease